ncbi:MAG: helix-turn-helix domain-containing protein [Polyangiaceae bacterium]
MRELRLNVAQRKALEAVVARRSAHAGHARRVRVVLLSADGMSGREIAERVGISVQHVSRIRQRFIEGGVAGLEEQPKAGRKDHAVEPETVGRIVQTALSPPPLGRARWTTRLLGKKFKLTSATISKVLRANGLKPHLVRTYKFTEAAEYALEGKLGPSRFVSSAARRCVETSSQRRVRRILDAEPLGDPED